MAVRPPKLPRPLTRPQIWPVRVDHTAPLNAVFTPNPDECTRALRLIAEFDAARGRGEERALFEGQWVEVPTYLNAKRMIERARGFGLIE